MNNGMMTYALSVSSDTVYKAFSPEAWAKALEVTILGMAMIFAVLSILWGVLALFKVIFANDNGVKTEKKATKPVPVKKAEEPVVETPAPEAVAVENDGGDELIAVITAAIAAYRAAEGESPATAGGFRVVSFKRAGTARAWNKKNG